MKLQSGPSIFSLDSKGLRESVKIPIHMVTTPKRQSLPRFFISCKSVATHRAPTQMEEIVRRFITFLIGLSSWRILFAHKDTYFTHKILLFLATTSFPFSPSNMIVPTSSPLLFTIPLTPHKLSHNCVQEGWSSNWFKNVMLWKKARDWAQKFGR